MKRRINLIAKCAGFIWPALCCLLLIRCGRGRDAAPGVACKRIISLAPAITESLFALGLGGNVVGVTRFCRYPPQAARIERIGDYTNPNLEKLLALKPDLVVMQKEHVKQREFMRHHEVNTLIVNYGTCASICSSFAAIGRLCDAQHKADSLVAYFDARLTQKTGTHSPKILLCIGRENPGGAAIRTVYLGGASTFYNDIIEAAGGVNAFSDSVPEYPKLSHEGLIAIKPDIIIDIASAMDAYSCSTLVADWKDMPMIPAVENHRTYCIDKDYATLPGPRIVNLVDDIERIIRHSKQAGD
ncbi:MAG: ABC transporter substrate-binding protein [Chitinivibrionales bacterium]|nr:ABC transporter substrate-binding protein [Chitinivibrionales bacterium]